MNKKELKEKLVRFMNYMRPSERIDEAKQKWNRLAKKNARYYVLTDKGESITEDEFREAGRRDVETHVLGDELLMSNLTPTAEKIALEIGCGIGRLSEFLAPHFRKLYAVDISEEMINQAKGRLVSIKNIDFIATDGVSFPIPSSSVDFVFSFIVFQHMPDKAVIRKNMEEIARVLQTKGVAKVQLRGIPVSKDKWYYGPSFTVDEIGNLVEGLPLEILKVEGEGQKYMWVWFEKR